VTTWNPRANELFLAARELASPEARGEFLDRECAGDATLRADVDALLGADDRAGSFLASPVPAPDPARPTDQPTSTERPGTVIGPYKLLEQIGEGGFGVVFLADQAEPVRRKVAVKVLKPGMDTRQVVARFEAERQALALMDHPNIAKVHDAGTTREGRPYFVMELVTGTPITRYCDEYRLLPRDRLGLFVQVCQAVQHAHQKGVIHRDLKPSNVLVASCDGRPVVKVIDFGVAKAAGQLLTEKTLHTGLGAVVGTPEYMSPEQATLDNLDVDTRSDVYSLGVLLYELLTGTTPLTHQRVKEAAFLEVLRVIREEDPPRPSTRLSESKDALPSVSAQRHMEPARLTKLVRGELDWIVMTALEKDRSRRYESANAFAADVHRYLAGEAVLAVPPAAGYRLRKFVRRNKTVLAAAAAGALMVLLGMAGLIANNRLVNREKEKAVREKERADRNLARALHVVNDYFGIMSQDRRLAAAGLHDLRRALLMSMASFLSELAGQEGDGPAVRFDRAWALTMRAKIRAEVGDLNLALADFEAARDAWVAVLADDPHSTDVRSALAECDNDRGVRFTEANRLDEAEAALRQSLAGHERLAAEFPAEVSHRTGIGGALHGLSRVARERKDPAAERRLLDEARTHQQAAVGLAPRDRMARASLGGHHNNLGVALKDAGETAAAEAAHREARTVFEQLLIDFPNDPELRQSVANCHLNLGALYDPNRPADAIEATGQAIVVLDGLVIEFPGVPDYRQSLAKAYHNLGQHLIRAGRPVEADDAFDKGLALDVQLAKERPAHLDFVVESAHIQMLRALQYADAGRFADAVGPLTRLLTTLEPMAGAARRGEKVRALLRNASGARADVLLRLGRYADALVEYDRALRLGNGENRNYQRVQRALALAYPNDHRRATAEAEAAVADPATEAFLVQDAAAVHAVASTAVPNDARLAERYAARAVTLLRRAFEKNYRAIAADVRENKHLAAIRDREDFRNLVREWEAKDKK